jgi:YegS/Rv2252/BmrU family lipid kinase
MRYSPLPMRLVCLRSSLGILPLGTAKDFAHSAAIPVQDLTAALQLAANAPPRWIDLGLLNSKPFVNIVSGGFGSRVTVETDPELKRRLGGLAYVLTGISRFAELSANRGSFRAEGFSWEGPFVAVAIGNGRHGWRRRAALPDALIDDGLLDLMILPELDHASRLDAFSHLLREGAAAVRAELVTARSSWIDRDPRRVGAHAEPGGQPS